ncbi:MAG: hypothetical protein LBC41_02620 [Clostridiales bacterium]|jgi:hypothetical protein|nr:hypothetical protein [Clostridiales bacterium]
MGFADWRDGAWSAGGIWEVMGKICGRGEAELKTIIVLKQSDWTGAKTLDLKEKQKSPDLKKKSKKSGS